MPTLHNPMSNYRRAQIPGGIYFFTVVTYRRVPLLIQPDSRRALREAILEARREYPFRIDAWVLLSEHLHCIWMLAPEDSDFSKGWGLIKAGFAKRVRDLFRREEWTFHSPNSEKTSLSSTP